LGLGERRGLASAGQRRLIREMDVFPVPAQQSIRELTLTGRTYEDVLSAAVWAVFQEGYRKGWGADGDHLKTREEVKMALDCGFTMITLDGSEHIGDGLEAVVRFAVSIYDEFLRGGEIDFELSIDETQTVTSPEDHYFVARELRKAGVRPVSLAPRFCGEFQKGVDYRGDAGAFEKEFAVHAGIAEEMGYKLSIHSGSDKFAVFPAIYRETGGNVHIKTAGTSWLEALRVIARREPGLFREIQTLALKSLPEAKRYYHITEDTANIPDITASGDAELPALLDQDDARQVLHITYGQTLKARGEAIYAALNRYENDYYDALGRHIGRHLDRG
ncbi:MAG: tagaturonate epimerase family protein, partial [Oscillospiraceae bacterium]|nr:tagaturonate epimerase family protein [Oscillospiraceae bacterium]